MDGHGSNGPVPRVSVIVPCHDLGRYLGEAVDSVLAQTFDDVEILVLDDGSTDAETLEILRDFERPKTRLFRTENRGLAAARNRLVAEARGEFVCALDADDLLEPQMLERSLAAFDRDPGLSFVSHWFRTFGDESWEWTPARCDFPALLDWNTVNGSALVRRADLLASGGWDESMREGCEDWDLWIGLVERGKRGHILPEFLFRYRRRAGSMSRLLFERTTFVDVWRQMVARHEETFRRYLPELLLRREALVLDGIRYAAELDEEMGRWLRPEVVRRRETAAALRAKAGRAREARARDETLALLPALENEAAALRGELERARARALELDAERHRLAEELRTIRGSASWRLTEPMRLLGEWARRRSGGEGS